MYNVLMKKDAHPHICQVLQEVLQTNFVIKTGFQTIFYFCYYFPHVIYTLSTPDMYQGELWNTREYC